MPPINLPAVMTLERADAWIHDTSACMHLYENCIYIFTLNVSILVKQRSIAVLMDLGSSLLYVALVES